MFMLRLIFYLDRTPLFMLPLLMIMKVLINSSPSPFHLQTAMLHAVVWD